MYMWTQTQRHVNVTIAAKQKKEILHSLCVCSLSHRACTILYCHLWRVVLYDIFPHDLKNDTIFRKSFSTQKVCCYFFCKFLWNIIHIKMILARYYPKCTHVFTWSTCYSCQILIELEFPLDFLKILKCQIS